MTQLDDIISQSRPQFEADLVSWLRIPSVSADPAFAADVRRAAQWLTDQMQGLGLSAELIETDRHPLIFAQSADLPNHDGPTVLVYGHYDVQPPDPLDEWITPPFEPSIRDGNVVARGATDDKGQLLTHIKSVEAWLKGMGPLPLKIKFLIEGEEEVGSTSLQQYIPAHVDQLRCDVVVISDTCQYGPGQPAVTYGLRGIAYYELKLQGAQQDLHSGIFGGAITNPAIALSRMLAALVDPQGHIQVPGFYDDVRPLSARERQQLLSLPFDERSWLAKIGLRAGGGEEGYANLERRWTRPSFDVNGLTSGYQGVGAKTVLPSRASAKFSFRLVPDQDPAKISQSLREMLTAICPAGISMELSEHHHSRASVVSLENPYLEAAARAIETGFGRRPVFIREGGSIPIVNMFREYLEVDTLLLGWGLDDDNQHGPNEKFSLNDFHAGIRASAYLWKELAAAGKGK